MKKHPLSLPIIAASACFVLALFLRFALIGYSFSAYVLAGIGIVILLYKLLAHYKKRSLQNVLTALICIFIAGFIAVEIPIINAAYRNNETDADYLIVLGAGVNGSTPSLSMLNRLDAALDYLNGHPDCVAILSGGQGEGENITEAQAMHDWLKARGIAENRIIIEDRATNTKENLEYSFKIIGEELDSSEIAVVSSEYHLYRAEYIARQMGTVVSGVAGITTYPVLRANYFIREAFAVVYTWVFGI